MTRITPPRRRRTVTRRPSTGQLLAGAGIGAVIVVLYILIYAAIVVGFIGLVVFALHLFGVL